MKFKLSNLGYNVFGFFNQRFLVEMFYNKYISGLILYLGAQTTKVMDKGSVEKFGPFGLEKSVTGISSLINRLSTGVVTSYALYILVGLIFYVSILYLTNNNEDSLLFIIVIFSVININNSFDKKKRYLDTN
jgi:NADH-ubiquinone oxidoreductase chain 5